MKPFIAALGAVVCLTAVVASHPASSVGETVRLLWRDPGAVASRDLYWGSGSEARVPKPPFTFVSENLTGTKPKINVTDAASVPWSVKFATVRPGDNEVHSEIAASRLVWALGYFVDENYFVKEGRIEGVKGLKRAAEVVGADGAFRVARFERRNPEAQEAGNWDIEENRFKGTRELSGLQTLMMLLGNWDYTLGNTVALRLPLANGDVEERYLVSDLGSTFGRMRGGAKLAPSRWNLEEFSHTKYLNGLVLGRLEFNTPLLGAKPLSIPIEHARWVAAMISQLTDAQIRQAFEASGASADDIAAFSVEVRKRITDLQAALGKNPTALQ